MTFVTVVSSITTHTEILLITIIIVVVVVAFAAVIYLFVCLSPMLTVPLCIFHEQQQQHGKNTFGLCAALQINLMNN